MFGIKGYIFIGGFKFPFENPPFEAMTGYDKGHEFVKSTIESLEKDLATVIKEGDPPKCTGYMFVLTTEKEVEV